MPVNPIVFKQGNLPLIITAPHGGLQKPSTIPDRKQKGSLLLADMYTREIAQGIMKGLSDHYHEATPHIIINPIARRKVDVNRPLNEGTESKQGEAVWKEYHHRVQQAIESVKRECGYGIIIDIHGHTHSNEMLELGYLLEPTDLALNTPHLDQMIIQKSSIGSLVKRYQETQQPHQFLYLLGDMLASCSQDKIAIVPSTHCPKPENDMDYFSGGYTTQTYHKHLDIVQLEIPKSIRLNDANRANCVQVIVQTMVHLLDTYYLVKSRNKL